MKKHDNCPYCHKNSHNGEDASKPLLDTSEMSKKHGIGWLIVIIAMIIIGYIFSLLMGKSFEFLLCMWLLAIEERLRENSKTLNEINKHLETIEMLNRIYVPKGGDIDERRATVRME